MPLRLPLFWLPMVIFGYIFAEIAAFIFIGAKIGILFSLCLIALSSMCGFKLLQSEMRNFTPQIKNAARRGDWQNKSFIRRIARCAAAFLLIPPGFISSACGLLLLIPYVQRQAAHFFRKKGFFPSASFAFSAKSGAKKRRQAEIIDLEPQNYHADDPENSPWRQP